jgi:ABC-type spermidine/putrescine transport system permease subunit II
VATPTTQERRGSGLLRRVRAIPPNAVAWGLPLLTWQALFLLAPAVLLVLMTFWTVRDFRIVSDYNVQNWVEVLQSKVFLDALVLTLILSLLAGGISIFLAFPFAYGLAFKVSPGVRRLAIALLIMPFFTSYLLRIYSWNFLLADQGPINYLLGKAGLEPTLFLGTKFAVVLGYLAYFFPLLTLILLLTLMNVDRRLIEAANNLGAGRWRSVVRIVLPSIKVGLVLAFGFALILAFGDVLSPKVLGSGRKITLGILISDVIKEGVNFPEAAVIALIMVAILLILLFAMTRFAFPHEREPRQEGPADRPAPAAADSSASQIATWADRPLPPGGRRRFDEGRLNRLADRASTVSFRLYILLCFAFIFLPIVSLVVFSFADGRFPTLPWPGFTTDWYTSLGDDPEIFPALKNSVIVAVVVGAVATLLGAMGAYFLNRWQFRGKNAYLGVVMIGPCIPLVILALALFIFLNQIHLSGTLRAVALSHVGLAAAFALALVRLRLAEMDIRLEQAAWNLGASEWKTVRRIVVPQLAPALVAAFFLTMAVSWDEFVISWFVSGFDTTLPVKIFNMIQGNVSPRINAIGSIGVGLSLLMITIAMGSLFLLGRLAFRKRQPGANLNEGPELQA